MKGIFDVRRWMRCGLVRTAGLALFASISLSSPAHAQKAWDDAIAAAKKEGALTLSIPPGKPWRDTLQLFQKDFPDSKLDMTESASRDF